MQEVLKGPTTTLGPGYQTYKPEIVITKQALELMKEYGASDPDNEVCGLLTGKITKNGNSWIVQQFHPIKNVNKDVMHARDAYTMDPNESFGVLKDTQIMSNNPKTHLIATFHTHPRYTPYPSSIDIATAAYKVVYIIYSPVYDKFTFNLWNGEWFDPIPVEVT